MTRLTKTGQPALGTTIEVELEDGEWLPVKVVGKGTGRDGHTLTAVWLEHPDGTRYGPISWPALYWRQT